MSGLVEEPETRESLLIRLRDGGDDRAWTEFTAIYEPVIYQMVRRRGFQDADAREIVQDVLMSVIAAINRFETRDGQKFRGWISRVTRNATVDRLRQTTARGEVIDADDAIRMLDDAQRDESARNEFETQRREQLFRWAAAKVRRHTSERNWTAFWRTCVEGQPISDVARSLDVPHGTVHVARCRILKRIREIVHSRLED